MPADAVPSTLPARGPAVRDLDLPLPPRAMPMWRGGRPLKRWSYVGVFAPELVLCAGDARIGPVPRRWWAVAEPDGTLHERASTGRGGVLLGTERLLVEAGGVLVDLALGDADPVETASPVGDRGGYAWTSKSAGIPVRGRVVIGGREHRLDGPYGFRDDSAGYHARHTAWRWSAGLGESEDGRSVGWNLVTGIHDARSSSERTIWVEGEPREAGPVEFRPDLSAISSEDGAVLRFTEWSAREERMNLIVVRSSYRQPFGTFSGALPGGIRLARGRGVMEDHDVYW